MKKGQTSLEYLWMITVAAAIVILASVFLQGMAEKSTTTATQTHRVKLLCELDPTHPDCVPACAPDTCASLGYECDSWDDGCGGTVDCGPCPLGEDCVDGICQPTAPDPCACADCADCTEKLNDPACDTVRLTVDISDHVGTCINNPAGFNDKVFDCQSHTMDGDYAGSDYGIRMISKSGNTIRNCAISDFLHGIRVERSSDSTISGNTLTNMRKLPAWGRGISLDRSSNIVITGNTANNNHNGIHLYQSTGCTITNNEAHDNERGGIKLYYGSGHTVTNNNVDSNTDHGIIVTWSNNNIITGNEANDIRYGIILETGSSGNTIRNNNANNNRRGITLYHNSDNNVIEENDASSNTEWGIRLEDQCSNNHISNNDFDDNGVYGVYVHDVRSNSNTISSNHVCGNPTDIRDADSNSGDGNTCDATDNWKDDSAATDCANPC